MDRNFPKMIVYPGRMVFILAAVVLFLMQAFRIYFSLLFGFLYDIVFEESTSIYALVGIIATILVFFSPLINVEKKLGYGNLIGFSAVLVFIGRILMCPATPMIRFIGALIVLAGGIYFIKLIWQRITPRLFGLSNVLAFFILLVLMVLFNGYDPMMDREWLYYQLGISVILCILTLPFYSDPGLNNMPPITKSSLLQVFSYIGILFLQLNMFTLPHVVGSWTRTSFELNAILLVLFTTLIFILLALNKLPEAQSRIKKIIALIWILSGLLIGYYYHATESSILLCTLQLAVLYPIMFLQDYTKPSEGEDETRIAWFLSIGFVLFFLFNIYLSLTFVNAYTLPEIDKTGFIPFILCGIFVTFAITKTDKLTFSLVRHFIFTNILVIAVAAFSIIYLLFQYTENKDYPLLEKDFTVGSYNIHYGFDENWVYNLRAMADIIERSEAGVVFLQEVDIGRTTSYSVDMCRWLSHRLNMQYIFCPTIEHLTGIAILTKYQMLPENPYIINLVESKEEQTGIIRMKLPYNQTIVEFYGTWLGLSQEERMRQLKDIFDNYIPPHSLACFGGDFNLRPDPENFPGYAYILEQNFIDTFAITGNGDLMTSPSIYPEERIDYIFIRGLQILATERLDEPASDHLMVKAFVTLE